MPASAMLDASQLAQHAGFRDRVLISVVNSAKTISNEASSGDARTDDLRKTLATNVLNDPDLHQNQFAWAVAATVGITLDSTDGAIHTEVANVWNAMAGV